MRRLLWCAALWALPLTAQAMDSATLLGHPARYRVLYADETEAVYADMDTVRRTMRGGRWRRMSSATTRGFTAI